MYVFLEKSWGITWHPDKLTENIISNKIASKTARETKNISLIAITIYK